MQDFFGGFIYCNEYIKPKKIGKIQRLLKKKLFNLLEQCIKYFTRLRKFNKVLKIVTSNYRSVYI